MRSDDESGKQFELGQIEYNEGTRSDKDGPAGFRFIETSVDPLNVLTITIASHLLTSLNGGHSLMASGVGGE
eukprot:scaffold262570_cov38-Prasinocladus_malaysianus.AAC.1